MDVIFKDPIDLKRLENTSNNNNDQKVIENFFSFFNF